MDTAGLALICAGLGSADEDDNGAVIGYTTSDYCLDNLKDLQRFLRRDDPQRRDVFNQLCKLNTVSDDLVPIIEHCQSDTNLVINAVKILVFLTLPIDLASDDVVQQMEHLWDLKAAVTRNATVAIIVSLLEEPLDHLERDVFTEDDWKMVQLVLTLFRNLLAIKNISQRQKASGLANKFMHLRDRFLEIMFQENVTDLILVLTQHLDGSCRYLQEDNLLLLEIFHHMFMGQDPASIVRASRKDSKDDGHIAASVDSLKSIMEQEQEKRRTTMLRSLKRHSQFSGTFTRLTMDGSKTLFKGNPAAACGDGLLKVHNVQRGPVKRIAWDHGSMTSPKEVLELLFNFLNQFLSGAYNVLMKSIRDDIQKEHQAVQNSDVIAFLQVADFVISFHHQKISLSKKFSVECTAAEASLDSGFVDNLYVHGDFCGPIAETMNEAMFHLLISKWREAFENLKELKDHKFLSAAVSLMKNMIRMLDLVLKLLPEDSKEPQTTRILLYKIFYDQTDQGFTQFLLNLFKSFDSHKQPKSDLADLLEIIHVVLRLMEKLQARGTLRVSKKTRKNRKKKIPKVNKQEAEVPREELVDRQNDGDWTHRAGMPTEVAEPIVDESAKEHVNELSSADKEDIAVKSGISISQPSAEPVMPAGSAEDDRGDSPYLNSDKQTGNFSSALESGMPLQDTEQLIDDSSHMDSDKDTSDDDNSPPRNEVDFNVSHLVASFANAVVIRNLCWLLKYYKSNSASINHYIICMLKRFCDDLDISPMLYQLSVLATFYDILSDKKSSEYANIVFFLTKFIRKMLKLMKKQPLLFVEILFWKTRKECQCISAEALMSDLVNMKKEIRDWDGEQVNLSNDEKMPGRKSIADSLGDDEADFVVPHDFSYQREETLSDGDHPDGVWKDKTGAVKRNSATLFADSDIDNDKSEHAFSDPQTQKASKRQKGPVFDQEQESAIKDLYAKYKDDRRCSHLIAETLDPDGKISPVHVSRKLRKLGLKAVSRKKLASSDVLSPDGDGPNGTAGDGYTSSLRPDSSNSPDNGSLPNPSTQKRKRTGAFSKEQEGEIKLLFERFKNHKKCSHMIADALDVGNKFTAAQISRKLKQLGLLLPRKRSTTKAAKHPEEVEVEIREQSDEETLLTIKERSKSKKTKSSTKEAAEMRISQHSGILGAEHDPDSEILSSFLKSKSKKSKPSTKETTLTSMSQHVGISEHDSDNKNLRTIFKSKSKKSKSSTKEAAPTSISQHEGISEHDSDNENLSTILKNVHPQEKVDTSSKDQGELNSTALNGDFKAELESSSRKQGELVDSLSDQSALSGEKKYDELEDMIDSEDDVGPVLSRNIGSRRILKMVDDGEDDE